MRNLVSAACYLKDEGKYNLVIKMEGRIFFEEFWHCSDFVRRKKHKNGI